MFYLGNDSNVAASTAETNSGRAPVTAQRHFQLPTSILLSTAVKRTRVLSVAASLLQNDSRVDSEWVPRPAESHSGMPATEYA